MTYRPAASTSGHTRDAGRGEIGQSLDAFNLVALFDMLASPASVRSAVGAKAIWRRRLRVETLNARRAALSFVVAARPALRFKPCLNHDSVFKIDLRLLWLGGRSVKNAQLLWKASLINTPHTSVVIAKPIEQRFKYSLFWHSLNAPDLDLSHLQLHVSVRVSSFEFYLAALLCQRFVRSCSLAVFLWGSKTYMIIVYISCTS
jgi:hypothetical protein